MRSYQVMQQEVLLLGGSRFIIPKKKKIIKPSIPTQPTVAVPPPAEPVVATAPPPPELRRATPKHLPDTRRRQHPGDENRRRRRRRGSQDCRRDVTAAVVKPPELSAHSVEDASRSDDTTSNAAAPEQSAAVSTNISGKQQMLLPDVSSNDECTNNPPNLPECRFPSSHKPSRIPRKARKETSNAIPEPRSHSTVNRPPDHASRRRKPVVVVPEPEMLEEGELLSGEDEPLPKNPPQHPVRPLTPPPPPLVPSQTAPISSAPSQIHRSPSPLQAPSLKHESPIKLIVETTLITSDSGDVKGETSAIVPPRGSELDTQPLITDAPPSEIKEEDVQPYSLQLEKVVEQTLPPPSPPQPAVEEMAEPVVEVSLKHEEVCEAAEPPVGANLPVVAYLAQNAECQPNAALAPVELIDAADIKAADDIVIDAAQKVSQQEVMMDAPENAFEEQKMEDAGTDGGCINENVSPSNLAELDDSVNSLLEKELLAIVKEQDTMVEELEADVLASTSIKSLKNKVSTSADDNSSLLRSAEAPSRSVSASRPARRQRRVEKRKKVTCSIEQQLAQAQALLKAEEAEHKAQEVSKVTPANIPKELRATSATNSAELSNSSSKENASKAAIPATLNKSSPAEDLAPPAKKRRKAAALPTAESSDTDSQVRPRKKKPVRAARKAVAVPQQQIETVQVETYEPPLPPLPLTPPMAEADNSCGIEDPLPYLGDICADAPETPQTPSRVIIPQQLEQPRIEECAINCPVLLSWYGGDMICPSIQNQQTSVLVSGFPMVAYHQIASRFEVRRQEAHQNINDDLEMSVSPLRGTEFRDERLLQEEAFTNHSSGSVDALLAKQQSLIEVLLASMPRDIMSDEESTTDSWRRGDEEPVLGDQCLILDGLGWSEHFEEDREMLFDSHSSITGATLENMFVQREKYCMFAVSLLTAGGESPQKKSFDEYEDAPGGGLMLEVTEAALTR